MSERKTLGRREFLRGLGFAAAGAALAACQPEVIKETVKETVIVEGEEVIVKETVEVVTEREVEKVVTATPGPPSPVELQWWSFGLGLPSEEWPHGKWEQSLADTYMEANEAVTIIYQAMGWDSLTKLYTTIAAGNPPNLVLRGGVDQILYAFEGNCALEFDLPDEFQEDLPEGWYEGMKFRGANYQIPFYVLANGMVINLTIAEEADAMDLVPEAPERSWSYDQYLELMLACSGERDGKQIWGNVFPTSQTNPFFYWPEQVLSWCWGTDTVAYEGGQWTCALGEEEGLAWLQWMQDLYYVHGVIPNPAGLAASRWEYWDQGALVSGVGPSIGWARRDGNVIDNDTLVVTDTNLDIDWVFVQNPINPGVEHPSYWGGPYLDVNTVPFRTRDQDAIIPTIDFGLWLSNRENQKWMAQYLLPARVSALEDVTDPMLEWHYKYWIPYGRQRAAANGGRAREVCEQLELVLQKVFQPMDPSEAVNDFCDTVASLEWFEV